jgi:hypothetical protein
MATAQTTTETSEYRYKPEQIDWDTMKNLGLSKEYLEKRNLLDPLLRGYKTNELLPIGINLGGSILRTDARLSLQQRRRQIVEYTVSKKNLTCTLSFSVTSLRRRQEKPARNG